MEGELAAYEGRMATMRAAARTRAGMDEVVEALRAGGVAAEAKPFVVPGDAVPLAWSLRGRQG